MQPDNQQHRAEVVQQYVVVLVAQDNTQLDKTGGFQEAAVGVPAKAVAVVNLAGIAEEVVLVDMWLKISLKVMDMPRLIVLL